MLLVLASCTSMLIKIAKFFTGGLQDAVIRWLGLPFRTGLRLMLVLLLSVNSD